MKVKWNKYTQRTLCCVLSSKYNTKYLTICWKDYIYYYYYKDNARKILYLSPKKVTILYFWFLKY